MLGYSLLEENFAESDEEKFDEIGDETSSLADDTANLMYIINMNEVKLMKMNNFYQLVDTIRTCGIDKSVLFLYNRNNQLASITGVPLPSIEEFDNGYRVSDSTSKLVAEKLIVSMEGNEFGDTLKAYYDDLLKPFRAGYRWYQSLSDEVGRLKARILAYIDILEEHKSSKLQGNEEIVSIASFKRAISNDVTKMRDRANSILLSAGKTDWKNDEAIEYADDMREIRDKVRHEKASISEAMRARTDTDLSRLSVSELINIGKQAVERCDSIIKMNQTYPGFWVQGYNTGKVHGYLSGILPGWSHALFSVLSGLTLNAQLVAGAHIGNAIHQLSVYFHRGIISACSVGWQVLSLTVDVDMVLCREVARTLRICSDRVK